MVDTRQRHIALLVASCFFMENLDGTIVTTAAPRIGTDLHVSSSAIGLVVTSYLITLAVLIPLSGWMVTRIGSRKVFLSAIVVFIAASAMCSTSVNLGELVAMRVLQGVGGAMMVPVGRLVVLSKTAKADMIRTISYIVWPGLIAPVVAPLAGGLITTYGSWRWLFLINIPLGAAALVVAFRLIPASEPSRPPRLDWLGVLLTCAGLGGLTYTTHLLSTPASSWASTAAIGSVSILLVAGSVAHLLRARAPLVDLRVLRVASFRHSTAGGSLFWVTIGAMPFLLPLLFENVFRWSPIQSGAVVMFIFIGNIGIKPATTYLLNRFGFRRLLILATSGAAGTVVGAGLISGTTPLVITVVVTLLSGVARSIGLTSYSSLGFSDIPEAAMRHANSLAATVQQLSAAFGIAAGTIALRLGTPVGGLFERHPSEATAYSVAFFLLAAVALLATLGATRLHPEEGSAVRSARATAQA